MKYFKSAGAPSDTSASNASDRFACERICFTGATLAHFVRSPFPVRRPAPQLSAGQIGWGLVGRTGKLHGGGARARGHEARSRDAGIKT